MTTEEEWQKLNREGFIPGPAESYENFQKRIVYCRQLKNNLTEPLNQEALADPEKSAKGLMLARFLYDISPDWVPLFFSNYQLAPWHAGCAWIFQMMPEDSQGALIQLRSKFLKRDKLWGIYERDELIAHELAHIGRMEYQEPKFEEMLAYMSLSSSWRRWLGPIVQSAKESLLFLFLVILTLGAQIGSLFFDVHLPVGVTTGLTLLPFTMVFLGMGRLIYRRAIFNRCLIHLEALYTPSSSRHLLYRLTDNEVRKFAKNSPEEIKAWMSKEADHSFRWRFLKSCYPF